MCQRAFAADRMPVEGEFPSLDGATGWLNSPPLTHFHWAKSGEYVTQISAIGPLGMEYLNPGDDPRGQRH